MSARLPDLIASAQQAPQRCRLAVSDDLGQHVPREGPHLVLGMSRMGREGELTHRETHGVRPVADRERPKWAAVQDAKIARKTGYAPGP